MKLFIKVLLLLCFGSAIAANQQSFLTHSTLSKVFDTVSPPITHRHFVKVINNLPVVSCGQSNCNSITVAMLSAQGTTIQVGDAPIKYYYSGPLPTLKITGRVYKRNQELCLAGNSNDYIAKWQPHGDQIVKIQLQQGVITASV